MSYPEQWFSCSVCGAVQIADPPHGLGNPCPQKVAVDEAYIEMLDAQRMAHVRSGGSFEDIARALVKIAGTDDE